MVVSCGGPASQTIGAGGGELCSPDNTICITIPVDALADDTTISIAPSSDSPAAALTPSWQIGPDHTMFMLPATVTMEYSTVTEKDGGLIIDDDAINPSVLRVYTRESIDGGPYGDWVALDNSVVDPRAECQGRRHDRSPLAVWVMLRADHLPDGRSADQLSDAGQ